MAHGEFRTESYLIRLPKKWRAMLFLGSVTRQTYARHDKVPSVKITPPSTRKEFDAWKKIPNNGLHVPRLQVSACSAELSLKTCSLKSRSVFPTMSFKWCECMYVYVFHEASPIQKKTFHVCKHVYLQQTRRDSNCRMFPVYYLQSIYQHTITIYHRRLLCNKKYTTDIIIIMSPISSAKHLAHKSPSSSLLRYLQNVYLNIQMDLLSILFRTVKHVQKKNIIILSVSLPLIQKKIAFNNLCLCAGPSK